MDEKDERKEGLETIFLALALIILVVIPISILIGNRDKTPWIKLQVEKAAIYEGVLRESEPSSRGWYKVLVKHTYTTEKSIIENMEVPPSVVKSLVLNEKIYFIRTRIVKEGVYNYVAFIVSPSEVSEMLDSGNWELVPPRVKKLFP